MFLNHVDIDTRDPRTGRTALSFAAEHGNAELTKLLLVNGSKVNIRQYSLSNHRQGRKVNQWPAMTSGRFPLHWAIVGKHSAIVDLLLQYGANPNSRNTAGRTCLQDACMENDLETVELLLQNGADVNARSYNHVCSILASLNSLGSSISNLSLRDGLPCTKQPLNRFSYSKRY